MTASIAYTVRHTFKHTLTNAFSQVNSGPIAHDILSGLWALRKHKYYHCYENSEKISLAELIDFDVVGSEFDKPHGFGFHKEDRDSYRKLAEPSIFVPDVTEMFTRGLLTDVVRATKEKVLHDGKLFDDDEMAKGYLRRRGLDIGVDQLRKIFSDKHAYATFIIGYCFPSLGDAEQLVDKYIPLSRRLENPVAHIEALLGRSL